MEPTQPLEKTVTKTLSNKGGYMKSIKSVTDTLTYACREAASSGFDGADEVIPKRTKSKHYDLGFFEQTGIPYLDGYMKHRLSVHCEKVIAVTDSNVMSGLVANYQDDTVVAMFSINSRWDDIVANFQYCYSDGRSQGLRHFLRTVGELDTRDDSTFEDLYRCHFRYNAITEEWERYSKDVDLHTPENRFMRVMRGFMAEYDFSKKYLTRFNDGMYVHHRPAEQCETEREAKLSKAEAKRERKMGMRRNAK